MPNISAEKPGSDIARQEFTEYYERTISDLEKKIPALQRRLSKAIRNDDPKSGLVLTDYLSRAFQILLQCREELAALKTSS